MGFGDSINNANSPIMPEKPNKQKETITRSTFLNTAVKLVRFLVYSKPLLNNQTTLKLQKSCALF